MAERDFSAKLAGKFVDDDDLVRTGRAWVEIDGFDFLHIPVPTGFDKTMNAFESQAAQVAKDAENSGKYASAAKSSASAAATSASKAAGAEGRVSSDAKKAQDGASRAETAAGNAKNSEAVADDAANRASDSASAASSSAAGAATSARNAGESASAAYGSAESAKADADRAANIASSTSWNGDKLTVNGKTSPSLRGPKGDSGASAWDDITGKPSTFPPRGHTHKREDITDLPSFAEGIVEGSIPIRGSDGTFFVRAPQKAGHVATKSYVDTAVASEKARTVGVTWIVPREPDVEDKASVAQTGDYIQVAQSHTIYRVTSGGVEVERYGTRTLQASTSPNSNRNPNQWLENDDPWAGVNWSRVSPPAGKWLIELINPYDFAADLYVEGNKVATATSGTAAYPAEFSKSEKSDVYVQIPGDNHYKPITLRFTPIK